MISAKLMPGLIGLGLLVAASGPALATARSLEDHVVTTPRFAPGLLVAQLTGDVEFGDDTSEWANDGECDDPRFEGEGSSLETVPADIMKDATDCQAAYEAGTVVLAESGEMTEGDVLDPAEETEPEATQPDTTEAETSETPAPATQDIDFGDDTSQWANDGECDDPRFTGANMALELVDADIAKDATDCQALFESGEITLAEDTDAPDDDTDVAEVAFGDDSGTWPNDDECDDPRFVGTGVAGSPSTENVLKDASDCRVLFESGSISLLDQSAADIADIDFGDDTGTWPNDGECDDPRFTGPGAVTGLSEDNVLTDATDCRAAYEIGTIALASDAGETDDGGKTALDFGDDTSQWANDGECDDPRFTGSDMAAAPVEADLLSDATDCRTAYEAGTITLIADGASTDIDFGADTSRWANDGECDDPRFMGDGVNKKLLSEDAMADATDCRALYAAGTITIRAVYDPAYLAGAPYDSSDIEFGNNTSDYANDNECDDPRFEGPGVAFSPIEVNEFRDAEDCRTAFEAGSIALIAN